MFWSTVKLEVYIVENAPMTDVSIFRNEWTSVLPEVVNSGMIVWKQRVVYTFGQKRVNIWRVLLRYPIYTNWRQDVIKCGHTVGHFLRLGGLPSCHSWMKDGIRSSHGFYRYASEHFLLDRNSFVALFFFFFLPPTFDFNVSTSCLPSFLLTGWDLIMIQFTKWLQNNSQFVRGICFTECNLLKTSDIWKIC